MGCTNQGKRNNCRLSVKTGMAEQRCQLFLDLLASRSFLSDYDVARSSPRQFFPDCTIAMCGYDFREGQGPPGNAGRP